MCFEDGGRGHEPRHAAVSGTHRALCITFLDIPEQCAAFYLRVCLTLSSEGQLLGD